MEVFLTVVTGFATFAFGQIAVKLLIDPVQEFKRVVADIAHGLIEYANVFGNPDVADQETERKVSTELRKYSSRLNAQMYLVPAYGFMSKIFGLPKKKNVVKAAAQLIGLSNGFGGNNPNRGVINSYRAQHVKDALGIFVPGNERLDPEHERVFING
ncbi:MAG: hypothetical protein HY308_04705 [Gammaproteobacteria bacterium]|nr:hypothetical protein [Gammaproteobacteria bacterium]